VSVEERIFMLDICKGFRALCTEATHIILLTQSLPNGLAAVPSQLDRINAPCSTVGIHCPTVFPIFCASIIDCVTCKLSALKTAAGSSGCVQSFSMDKKFVLHIVSSVKSRLKG